MLDQLVELFEERKVFRRRRKDWKVKALSMLLYHMGLSYRKTRDALRALEPFSHSNGLSEVL